MSDKPQKSDLVTRAYKLLADMQKEREGFRSRTHKILAHAEKIIKELEGEDPAENLKTIERKVAQELDGAVLDYVAELDEEGISLDTL